MVMPASYVSPLSQYIPSALGGQSVGVPLSYAQALTNAAQSLAPGVAQEAGLTSFVPGTATSSLSGLLGGFGPTAATTTGIGAETLGAAGAGAAGTGGLLSGTG